MYIVPTLIIIIIILYTHTIASASVQLNTADLHQDASQILHLPWEVSNHLEVLQGEPRLTLMSLMFHYSPVPRPPRPAFVASSMKSGGKTWKILSHDTDTYVPRLTSQIPLIYIQLAIACSRDQTNPDERQLLHVRTCTYAIYLDLKQNH